MASLEAGLNFVGLSGAASANVSIQRMLSRTSLSASDELEGRRPGTQGETLTIEALSKWCRDDGLSSVLPDGRYAQQVQLTELEEKLSQSSLKIGKGNGKE